MKKQGSYLSLLKIRTLRGLLSLAVKGYFIEKGWLESYSKKQAIDQNGEPIPWLTYSFLDFINGRLNQNLTLFEYGSGNSTLFFAKQLKYIKSIEYDSTWYNNLTALSLKNVSLSFIALDTENESYETAILREKQSYDIILVDGRRRVKCTKLAVQKLNKNGIIILDDSERAAYSEVFSFMKEQGFKHLPFSGIAIGAIHNKCTSIFYRADNVLGI